MFYILSVYWPYHCNDKINTGFYVECLSTLQAFIQADSSVYIIGDFNCDIHSNSLSAPYLSHFITMKLNTSILYLNLIVLMQVIHLKGRMGQHSLARPLHSES